MKKSIFQLIIIGILVIGMIGVIFVVKYSLNNKDYSGYYPIERDNDGEQQESFSLDNYTSVELLKHSFPKFNDLKSAFTYFDEELSFENYQFDNCNLKLGDVVQVGTVIGTYNDEEITSDCNGLVVKIENNEIIIKNLTNIYVKFSHNIYSSKVYHMGDIFDVYKNGNRISTARIINIDYYNIREDCIEITLLIDNSNLQIKNSTYVEFELQGYAISEELSIESKFIDIANDEYRLINKVYSFMCKKNGILYEVNIEFGVSYYGYVEILGATYNYEQFDLTGGQLYAKNGTD